VTSSSSVSTAGSGSNSNSCGSSSADSFGSEPLELGAVSTAGSGK